MKKQIKRWVWIATGWMFIVLGILGLFLPLLQGVLFLFIGLLILSSEYVWAHQLLQKFRAKFPRIAARVDQLHERFRTRWRGAPARES